MEPAVPNAGARPDRVLTDGLEPLVSRLRERGCTVVAPVARDRVIGLSEIESAREIATGWTDVQEPGHYRAEPGGSTVFGHAAPNTPWKRWLRPERGLVVRSRRSTEARPVVEALSDTGVPLAFVGVQSCDLAALRTLDVVLGRDADYRARRARLTIVAVACAEPAATCFCASVGTGPWPGAGADIVLREIADGTLLASAATDVGEQLLDEIGPLPMAGSEQIAAADRRIAEAAARQTRRLDPATIDAAAAAPDHPGWIAIAERCLTCANCTLVCPTCFCTSVVDSTSLDGDEFERRQRWDSCFSLDFSYIHGGSVRTSAAARYRQWYLHKLVTWHDQFGASGCVGCGRCITWCPTGIDITEAIVHA
jgi:sulfhydrogenase subunit beta (sulfur reductase)